MKVVHKLKLSHHKLKNKVSLPKGAEIVKVHTQLSKSICLWYSFDLENEDEKEERVFRLIATGEKHEDNLLYVGTAFIQFLVVHVFEEVS